MGIEQIGVGLYSEVPVQRSPEVKDNGGPKNVCGASN